MTAEERGQVTAFVVILCVALLAVAGLVLDGGYALAARVRASDEAVGAARAGAKVLAVQAAGPVGAASGSEAAVNAANYFLARAGRLGTVRVDAERIVVTVRFDHPTTLLRVLGIERLSITGRGEAPVPVVVQTQ